MIFSTSQAQQQIETKHECTATNKTSYVRSEGLRIDDMPKATLAGITLSQCAEKCSLKSEGVDCHAFEYNALSQSCALTSVEGQPFGTSFLMRTHEPGIAFFQQICIPTSELCDGPYAFERFPQHVLIGSALEVKLTDGLSDCLRLCLEAKHRLNMDCRSVMFYYESGECILNRDMRQEYPNLFTNDTQYHLVDYFENNCFDISCFDDSQVHWIRSESYRIGVEKDVIMAGISAEECRKACLENRVDTETFPCRGYTYSGNNQECHLTAESSLITDSVKEISGDSRISLELSSISAGQYFEKYCVPGKIRCTEASFEYVPGRMLDTADKVLKTNSIGECFYACLSAGAECDSLMYYREEQKCVLNKKSQFSYPELFKPSPNVDYYDNICEYVPGTLTKSESISKPDEPQASFDVKTSNDAKILILDKLNKDANQSEQLEPWKNSIGNPPQQQSSTIFQEPQQPEKIKGTLETECKLDGIVMTARFENPTSGALFIKDHSATCRKIFESALEARLEVPYPSSTFSNPDCPGVELAPALWSFIVVIQKNNIGIPSLMTGTDRIFNVTCDYSNVVQEKKQLNSTTETTVKPQSDEPSERIRMAIFRDGKPVTTVSLGEELELRWIYNKVATKSDPTPYGFFVDECIAERLDGMPPDPAPLPLVTKGCPDSKVRNRLMRFPIIEVGDGFSTKMKVFRFDGSRRVRIRCAVNICVERCAPAICEMSGNGSHSVQSYGRKKRQTLDDLSLLLRQFDQAANSNQDSDHDSTNEASKILVTLDSVETKPSQQVIEQSTISGAYTIVDDEEKEPPLETEVKILPKLEELRESTITETSEAMTKEKCVPTIKKLDPKFKVRSSTEFYSAYFDGKSPTERESDLRSFLTFTSAQTKSSTSDEDRSSRTTRLKSRNSNQIRRCSKENLRSNMKAYKYIV
uniref:Uncharacterized protein n=1 Tax=Acrobeloides nanus TaxID=290746 RepID=A0A914BYX6_9BILA